jgi:hypothetical protein
MKQLKSTKSLKQQISSESAVLGLYEASSQTEFAAARINVIR